MHHQLSRPVVELVRLDRFQEAQIVDLLGQVGHQLRHPCTGITVLLEIILRPQHARRAVDEREAFAFQERLRALLAVELFEIRLVVEQFQLAGCTDHVQVDHPLDLGRLRRRQWAERIGGVVLGIKTMLQRCIRMGTVPARLLSRQVNGSETSGGFGQELPATGLQQRLTKKFLRDRFAIHLICS